MTEKNKKGGSMPLDGVAAWSRNLAASLTATGMEECAARLADGLTALVPETRVDERNRSEATGLDKTAILLLTIG